MPKRITPWVRYLASPGQFTFKPMCVTAAKLNLEIDAVQHYKIQFIGYILSMRKRGRPMLLSTVDEALAYIKTNVMVDNETGCHIWQGFLNGKGTAAYASMRINRRKVLVTRVILGILDSPNMQACHRCDNVQCVNPAHLFTGTRSDNAKDAVAKGRHKTQKGWAYYANKNKE